MEFKYGFSLDFKITNSYDFIKIELKYVLNHVTLEYVFILIGLEELAV